MNHPGNSIPQDTAVKPAAGKGNRALGVQLYTIQDQMKKDSPGTLKELADIGYREVESFFFGETPPAQLREMLDDAGLKCPSAHLGFGLAETDRVLEQAHTLGAHYAVSSILLPGPLEGFDMAKLMEILKTLTLSDFTKIAANANEIGAAARKAGLQYAYHNHNFEFRDYDGQTGYEILLRETDPELVKFEADCGWMVIAGHNPIDYFTRYPGRYRLMHAKDFPAGTPVITTLGLNGLDDNISPTAIGRGHIDYRPILAAAQQAGIEHIFVEQDPPIKDMTSLEAVRISYETLRKIVS